MLNAGYFEEIMDWHKKNPDVPLRFFWDKKEAEEIVEIDDHFTLSRLNDQRFLQSMAGCMAYATTSGFESVCEALYYRKPILMIPVHVEQEFNAFLPEYAPDESFRDWVHQAEERFIKEICG